MPKLPKAVNQILHGDSYEILKTLEQKFDLVFCDPPFNIGQPYTNYDDRRDVEEYYGHVERVLAECWRLCRGVMALHGPDHLCEFYLHLARKYRWRRVAWVNWHYNFGQCNTGNWIDARCHLLVFSKKRRHTWNPQAVMVESARVKYGDKRIQDSENGGRRLPGTVWGIPSDGPYWGRVQGNNKERMPERPNQLPEVYLERIIKAYTNSDDWVLDAYAGTGTTAVVAQTLGRYFVTIDIDKDAVEAVYQRLNRGAVRV